ncbi:MAG: sigma-54 interaction domain-containing protein [Anaerovoracaceae bacterium]|jgi:transcriptional regulator with PAS, ATPase and Fis domain|nr:sigma 54-interacting transcriptional regulator [Clostridiales bacterium]
MKKNNKQTVSTSSKKVREKKATDRSVMLSSILDNIDIAIVAVDKEGVVFYANENYGIHIGKHLRDILGKKLQNVYEGSTTITALKTEKKVVVEKKVCPVDNTKYVTGIASPIFDGNELKGAFSLYMDLPSEGVKLENSTQTFFSKYVRQKLYDSMKELEEYNIIGQSATFLQIIEKASIIAETDVPIMIRGEHGVGKEVIAKYIHRKSKRCDKPFVVINCAAIPENLVESELFGYEGGSFTGARAGGKIGKFELANGGTLFLDEIGDMPLMMQPKLLRAIQEYEIEKIGSEKAVSIDVRIICATNQPLEKMILEKKFREDLYYRVNSFSIHIPPLRERKEDITLLIQYYLNLFNKKYGRNISLSPEAISHLYHYSWPGNIREIRNCLENAVIMCENDVCDASVILNYLNQPYDIGEQSTVPEVHNLKLLSEIVADAEKNAIVEALEITNNNKTEAMRILGLSRKTFYRKMNDYKLL